MLRFVWSIDHETHQEICTDQISGLEVIRYTPQPGENRLTDGAKGNLLRLHGHLK